MIEYSYHPINAETRLFYAWFYAMHTRIDILLCDVDESRGVYLCECLESLIHDWEKVSSRFDSESDLYNLNILSQKSGGIYPVSKSLFRLLKEGIFYTKKTQGYFDVTVQSSLKGANRVSMIHLLEDQIEFKKAGIEFDFGGFAKGFVLDECVAFLRNEGIENALLNFGNSSIYGMGHPPHGEGWPISPSFAEASEGREVPAYLLDDQALTTSGHPVGQSKHILNKDQQFVENKNYVSVVTNTATQGEVYSLVFFVAPEQECEPFLKEVISVDFFI